MALWTLTLGFGAISSRVLNAQNNSVEVMGGSAVNIPTPLSIYQQGYPEIKTTAHYDTKPFGPDAPYYAWRYARWSADWSWEITEIHHRLFLSNPPDGVQYFGIHYGYNYFLVGRGWKWENFIIHFGAGPVVTAPDTSVRDKVRALSGGLFDAGYYFSGVGVAGSIEKRVHLSRSASLVMEVGITAADAWDVPIADGHADVPNLAVHGRFGVDFDF
jgi:hypothetical protein